MIKIIGLNEKNEIEEQFSLTNLDINIYKWFWVDFYNPSNEEIKHLSETFHFHPLAIEDCVHRLQRPKLDYYEGYTFYVTHSVREEEKEIIKEELDFFIGEKFVVTFHEFPSREVTQVWGELLRHKEIEKWDTFYVYYQVLDKIVDNYFPLIYRLEDILDEIEKNTQNNTMRNLMNELFDTRFMLLDLRHTINPMRDLLYRMLNSHHLIGIKERR